MSDWKIRFGTAGTSDSFAAQGYKRSLDVPEYTAKMGLNAFEYLCGRGVRLGEAKAKVLAQRAAERAQKHAEDLARKMQRHADRKAERLERHTEHKAKHEQKRGSKD